MDSIARTDGCAQFEGELSSFQARRTGTALGPGANVNEMSEEHTLADNAPVHTILEHLKRPDVLSMNRPDHC